jgi:hypothetical protein
MRATGLDKKMSGGKPLGADASLSEHLARSAQSPDLWYTASAAYAAGVVAESLGYDGVTAAQAAQNAAQNNALGSDRMKEYANCVAEKGVVACQSMRNELDIINRATNEQLGKSCGSGGDAIGCQGQVRFAHDFLTNPLLQDPETAKLFANDIATTLQAYAPYESLYRLEQLDPLAQWAHDNPRKLGGLQAAGGIATVAGLVLTGCGAIVGCVVGGAAGIYFGDQAAAGVMQVATGKAQETYFVGALRDAGLGEKEVFAVDFTLGLGLGVGAGAVALARTPSVTPGGKQSSLINEPPALKSQDGVNWGAITDAEAGGYSFYDQFKTIDGTNWNWPPNLGFEGSITHKVLPVGRLLDRYGNPKGSFMSPYGLSYESRALPPGAMAGGYHVYEVIAPLPVKSGNIAPAFGQSGGGIQLLPDFPTRVNVEWLIDKYLKEVD